MTPIVKRNINMILPLVAASFVVYKMDPKFQDPKRSVIAAAVTFLIVLLITNQITSYLLKESQKPKDGEVPITADGFDERTFCTRLYTDITCYFCWRDKQLYKDMAGLTDAETIALNRYWNDNYFSKVGESLRVAINGEVLGIELGSYLNTINSRFDNLNIQ